METENNAALNAEAPAPPVRVVNGTPGNTPNSIPVSVQNQAPIPVDVSKGGPPTLPAIIKNSSLVEVRADTDLKTLFNDRAGQHFAGSFTVARPDGVAHVFLVFES